MFLKWLALPALVFCVSMTGVMGGEGDAKGAPVAAQAESAQAWPLTLLPAAAKIVVMLDAHALDENKALEPILNKFLGRNEVAAKLGNIQEAFGFDLRHDLSKVVFCIDPCEKNSHFILLEGTFDGARIQEMFLNMRGTLDVHGTHNVYALPDENELGKLNYVSFVKHNLLAFGRQEAVTAALDKADQGTIRTINSAAQLALEIPGSAVLRVGADDLARMPGPDDPVRPAVRSFAFALSLGDTFQAKALARCKDETAAKDVTALAEGAAALGRLMLAKRPELLKILKDVTASVHFAQEGSAVRGSAALPSADAAGVLLCLIELQARKAAESKITAVNTEF